MAMAVSSSCTLITRSTVYCVCVCVCVCVVSCCDLLSQNTLSSHTGSSALYSNTLDPKVQLVGLVWALLVVAGLEEMCFSPVKSLVHGHKR